MRASNVMVVLTLATGLVTPAPGAAQRPSGEGPPYDRRPVAVTGPMLIAFTPVWPGMLVDSTEEAQNAVNEFLSDFDAGLVDADSALRARGVRLVRRTTDTLVLRRGGRRERFARAGPEGGAGYVLVAPGRRARVVWGIMPGFGLIELAEEYFGPAKGARSGPKPPPA